MPCGAAPHPRSPLPASRGEGRVILDYRGSETHFHESVNVMETSPRGGAPGHRAASAPHIPTDWALSSPTATPDSPKVLASRQGPSERLILPDGQERNDTIHGQVAV